MNASQYSNILSPSELRRYLPLPMAEVERIAFSRDEIKRVLFENDERFLLVVGPCSVHDTSYCLEYAERLASLQSKYSSLFYIVMRCYLEKSRTALGWRGFASSPDVDGKLDMEAGLRRGREFLLNVAKLGLPIAYEVVDPLVFAYFEDMVSWASIGARSVRGQMYRLLASAYQFPFAFKNTVEGDLQVPCDALLTARSSHSFLTIDDAGFVSSCITKGNPYSHLVLRGYRKGDESFANYDEATLQDARELLLAEGLPPFVLVDASHDNCARKPERQETVFFDVLQKRYGEAVSDVAKAGSVDLDEKTRGKDVSAMIRGVMLESFIAEGAISEAEFCRTRRGDVSITDACMGWERTERILKVAYEKYTDAREKGVARKEAENVAKTAIVTKQSMSGKKIEIYTDGACSGNPGRGGWGFVIVEAGRVMMQKSGFELETTNNRMEMQAVIEALSEVSRGEFEGAEFTLFTDSSYVKNGITQWITKWKQNGWKSSSKAPVKNQDLWLLLDLLASPLGTSLEWKWVRGHAGNRFNEQCDRLATVQAQSGKGRDGSCGEEEQRSLF